MHDIECHGKIDYWSTIFHLTRVGPPAVGPLGRRVVVFESVKRISFAERVSESGHIQMLSGRRKISSSRVRFEIRYVECAL